MSGVLEVGYGKFSSQPLKGHKVIEYAGDHLECNIIPLEYVYVAMSDSLRLYEVNVVWVILVPASITCTVKLSKEMRRLYCRCHLWLMLCVAFRGRLICSINN